ncbi:MAG: hypothetical protein IE889_00260 [Campylobacterales bacterium]|nr:hypothetical protein [Campylobacterales bacterium]
MHLVKRIIGGFFLTLILLWLLAPKEEIYYLLEQELNKQDIIISNEQFTDRWYGLEINHADIYVKGINMAQVGSLRLNLFFLYNSLTVDSILTDKGIHNVAPESIDTLSATYSVINPMNVVINTAGSFGAAEGSVNLAERHLMIRLTDAKEITAFRKFLKKDTEGFYYETGY